jgi:dihydroorotate dehydrogenase electron transfer subunit
MPVDVDARVLSNERLTGDYNVLTLEAPEIARTARPGQFVMVKPGTRLDPLLRRPFSVFERACDAHGAPVGISILNKRVGVGTRLLFDLAPGDRLPCLGPLGRPFTPVSPPASAWMIAGGVGLAPFATLADALSERGTPMVLFYGGRSAADLHRLELFERAGARLVLTTEDGTRGEHGRVTAPLERALQAAGPAAPLALYACGPTPMMHAVARLAARDDRPCQVSLEPIMGCGLGGCYSCVVAVRGEAGRPHHVRSCLEGPVFAADRIVWERLAH